MHAFFLGLVVVVVAFLTILHQQKITEDLSYIFPAHVANSKSSIKAKQPAANGRGIAPPPLDGRIEIHRAAVESLNRVVLPQDKCTVAQSLRAVGVSQQQQQQQSFQLFCLMTKVFVGAAFATLTMNLALRRKGEEIQKAKILFCSQE